VLKLFHAVNHPVGHLQPPSRGCVLKQSKLASVKKEEGSRLRAAVC